MFTFLLTYLRSDASISMHNPFYCFSRDPIRPQIAMFATETPYEAVRGQRINSSVSSCEPSGLWMFTRHGSRLPTTAELGKIFEYSERIQKDVLRNYDDEKTSLCASDIELIRNWRFDPNITVERQQYLTESGWDELQGLAERLQEAFPTILPSIYSPTHFYFRPTATQRTFESLRAFADGLFGSNGSEHVRFEEPSNPDKILAPNQNCQLYNDIISVNEEQEAFAEGPEFQEMLTQVSNKLGFFGSHHLRASEVETLMYLCKYEQGWEMESSAPWCSAFSIDNHIVHEYYRDLNYYYRYGYGRFEYRNLFENFNCHAIQDLLNFLQSNAVDDFKVKVFGGHVLTLQMLMVTFGVLGNDEPLTRHNFAQQAFREWKASLLCPMAGNLAVIRFK